MSNFKGNIFAVKLEKVCSSFFIISIMFMYFLGRRCKNGSGEIFYRQ